MAKRSLGKYYDIQYFYGGLPTTVTSSNIFPYFFQFLITMFLQGDTVYTKYETLTKAKHLPFFRHELERVFSFFFSWYFISLGKQQ